MTGASLRVGVDLVQVSQVADSIARFGDRYLRRVYTEGELAYATAAGDGAPRHLAARFAAKEAAVKALDLADAPLDWRQIEVLRESSGRCALALHGAVRAAADRLRAGPLAVSLSHEGDYATAVVITTLHEKNA